MQILQTINSLIQQISHKMAMMVWKAYQFISLLIWSGILIKVTPQLRKQQSQYFPEGLNQHINFLRIAQTFQLLTPIILVVSTSSLNPLKNFFGNFGYFVKTYIVWTYLQPQMNKSAFIFMATTWAIWQITLRIFSLVGIKEVKQFYYNFFILMYPIDVFYSIYTIYSYYEKHKKQQFWNPLLVAVSLILYSLYVYVNMWDNRSKYYFRQSNKDKIN